MSDQSDLSKPLKTWSHLAGKRRRPSEYEIVSTNLLWSTDDEMPWALSPDIDMNKWYLRYRNNSPLKHEDWDAFRDPDEVVYRSYNVMQDGHETYVDGLLRDHAKNAHDAAAWAPTGWRRWRGSTRQRAIRSTACRWARPTWCRSCRRARSRIA